MYKLFLTFRYLTRKAIVVFPILVVWLCVMMMIIVTSIMGGFVERVQEANRQLLGDIVIEAQGRGGFPYYGEFQKELEKVPGVVRSTPIVRAYGLINLPEYRFNNFAQVVGIDPVARANMSSFGESLHRQHAAPKEALEDLSRLVPATGKALQETSRQDFQNKYDAYITILRAKALPALTAEQMAWRWGVIGGAVLTLTLLAWLVWKRGPLWKAAGALAALAIVIAAGSVGWDMLSRYDAAKQADLLADAREQAELQFQRADRTLSAAMGLKGEQTYKTREELAAAVMPKEPSFTPPAGAEGRFLDKASAPKNGLIVGIDVIPGMFPRDRRGNYRHPRSFEFAKAVLTVVPVTPRGSVVTQPQSETFMIVDDSYTRVYDVDSTYVYAPFETVQKMALMQAYKDEDGEMRPARTSELAIQVKDSDDPSRLKAMRETIQERFAAFSKDHPDLTMAMPIVQTWEEKQAKYIEAVRNEKRMLTFILGLMSVVVLVVIFLIFYMIVRDKTKDIGIIKALGGSEEGVAAIFMSYGLFIGAVGGLLGMLTGVIFVWHTNEIHEWIYRTTGIMIWNRSVYLFDRIPDTVNWGEVSVYVFSALLAGLIGALIPAIVAGVQDPVKAVRYE